MTDTREPLLGGSAVALATRELHDAPGAVDDDLGADDVILDDMLVEDVSIDGMCGVY